jgi:hypothetical protein
VEAEGVATKSGECRMARGSLTRTKKKVRAVAKTRVMAKILRTPVRPSVPLETLAALIAS